MCLPFSENLSGCWKFLFGLRVGENLILLLCMYFPPGCLLLSQFFFLPMNQNTWPSWTPQPTTSTGQDVFISTLYQYVSCTIHWCSYESLISNISTQIVDFLFSILSDLIRIYPKIFISTIDLFRKLLENKQKMGTIIVVSMKVVNWKFRFSRKVKKGKGRQRG